ncbi:unnamed protein product [Ectocarpus sp. 8 AP-2014]
MTAKSATSKTKSPLMQAKRALCAVTCGAAAVAAFIPIPHVRPVTAGRLPCAAASPPSPETKREPMRRSAGLTAVYGTTAEATGDATAVSCTGVAPRAVTPVVLICSDRAALQTFAEHLWSTDSSTSGSSSIVVDLGEMSNDPRGAELALAGTKADGVLVCRSTLCLDHPDLKSMVHAHPLTVHLALDTDDTDTLKRCEQATKYTVVVGDGRVEEDYAKAELSRLVAFSRKPKPSPADVALDMGKNTFFLSLTFEDFSLHTDLLPTLTEGVDAMELRVDLLADNEDPYTVLRQLSILRRHTGNLPVVFTIRSKGQCGAFPDDPEKIFRLARWGLRAGCEVMDVEANWPMSYREGLIREAGESYPGAVLVGSYHVVGRKTTEEQAKELFMECYHDGAVDGVKVVTTAFEPEDSIRVHAAAKSLALPVPYIGLCLTETGKLSRVLNERFTPVTHENLPFVAAPGQMSSKEIMHHRAELGLCPPRSFFLFGSPISASPSPDMHNAGFRSSGLPHEYFLCEGEDPAIMAEALSRPDFGGASVTIPHKQNVLPLLDEVSEAAEAIGAVNTVIVGTDPETGARRLRGDNTDWLGILRPVKARLEASSGWEQGRGGVALVVGAGGAAMGALFAMQRLGLEVVVYNRTPSKAEELAGRFGGAAVSALDAETLEKACGAAAVDVVVSTIPAAAEFTLPDYLLESKPVVFDAAYKPALTSLLAQAKEAHCPYVQGADMLVEQGLEQFQLWTERRAPRDEMEGAVFAKVDRI